MAEWNKKWDHFFKEADGNQYPFPGVIRFVARNFYKVPDRRQTRILDLGCGTGSHLWYLAREGFDTYGVDASTVALTKAKKKLTDMGLPATIKTAFFTKLPFDDQFMDAVLDVTSLQNNDFDTIKSAVKEIYRVLKPGGKFFGMMIEDETERNELFNTHYFSREEILNLMDSFQNINIDHTEHSENNSLFCYRYLLVECQK